MPLNVLALVWVVAWVLPWFWTDPPPRLVQFSSATNAIVWVFFVIDYVVRLWLSHPRARFVRTHPVDLLVIVLPPLRVLRGLRLLTQAFKRSNGQLVQSILILVGVVVFFGAALVWQLEIRDPAGNIKTFPESLWWAAVTTTTVGYGDFYPVTLGGRLTASGLMLVGIGLVGTVSATLASWFVKRRQPAQPARSSGAEGGGGAAASVDDATVPTAADLTGRIDTLHARIRELDAEQQAVRDELWELLAEVRASTEAAG
jgi:voltage-gated potassium channel